MSYNGSGTFVINSTGQPVVTGTVISSSTFNSLTADLGTGLSTAITKDGQTTTTAKIPFAQGLSAAVASNFAAGTVGAPSIYLSTDTTTGLYRIGANNVGFAVSGVKLLDLGSALVGVTGALTISTTLNVTGVATLGNGAILGTPASGTVTNLTGTASININGTVGATTATTGAFTSGTFSTSITVGTAASSTGVFAAVQGTSATVSGTNTFWQDTAPIFGIFNLSNTANTVAGLRFGLGSANNAVAAIAGVQESTTLGALAFYTGGQGRANTVPERMRIDSAGAVTIPGTLGVTGTITPGQTTGIVGTTTNNNVQAGSVGEFISASVASGSAVTLTSDAAANVTTISLTAGDWDVSGVVLYLQPGTTSINNAFSGPSQTSATLGAVGSYSTIYNQGVSAADPAITSPVVRMSLSGTTTIYLVARSNFSVSTLKAYGFISARRVR